MSGAEVILGVVAGGAGLASLSIQLAESAIKLRRLYHSIKDAPSTMKEIADEVEVMSLSLKYLERHRQSESHGSDLLDQCIKKCQAHVEKINLLTEEISRKLDIAGLVGRLHTAMRERDLDKLLGDLARARSALHLAVDLYHRAEEERRWRMQETDTARRQDQMAMCLVALQALQENQVAMTRDFQPIVQRSRNAEILEIDEGSECTKNGDDSGILDNRFHNSFEHRRYRRGKHADTPAFRVRIKLPTLFSSRVWEIARVDAEQGWDLYFRTYSVHPWDSLIFHGCESGDLEGVRRLIRNGEASLLDIDPEGNSLITVSMVRVIYMSMAKSRHRRSDFAKTACYLEDGFLIVTCQSISPQCAFGSYGNS